MANDTVTSRPRCLFVQRRPIMRTDRGGSCVTTLAPTTGWKLTNHQETYLSIQCHILCNCCSSVPITYQCFLCGSGFGMSGGPPAHGTRPAPPPLSKSGKSTDQMLKLCLNVLHSYLPIKTTRNETTN